MTLTLAEVQFGRARQKAAAALLAYLDDGSEENALELVAAGEEPACPLWLNRKPRFFSGPMIWQQLALSRRRGKHRVELISKAFDLTVSQGDEAGR